MNKTFVKIFLSRAIRHYSLCDVKFEFIKLKSPRTKQKGNLELNPAVLFHISVVLKIYYCVLNFYYVLNTDPV